MRRELFFIGVCVIALAAGCGGGGSGGASSVPRTGSPAGQSVTEPLRITFPAAASGASRRPSSLTPNTASFSLQLYTVNGATPNPLPTPLTIALTNPQYCTTSAGVTTCSVNYVVPVATAVVIQLETFDGSGTLIGGALIGPINTTLATIPAQNVTVGGVIASLSVNQTTISAGDDGGSNPVTFTVTAKDPDGNTIIPPGNYPVPIAFSVTGDPNGALSFSPSPVLSPGPNGTSTVTVTYNSAKALTGPATITASSGSATASLSFAPIVFSPLTLPSLVVGGNASSVTISEIGYGGAFTPATSPYVTTACSPSNCTPTAAGGPVTITVSPVAGGTVTLAIADANGGVASVPIKVTQSGAGGPVVGGPYTIHEYTTSSGGTNYGIAVGPDGKSLWFVDQANETIGAVPNPAACAATCTLGEVPVPIPGEQLPAVAMQAITSASDGNLYIADEGNFGTDTGSILQASCTAATFTCASGNNLSIALSTPAPADVIAGPDGNLYATSGYANAYVSSIMMAPVSACCSTALNAIGAAYSPSAPNQMAVESGNTLWFTDTANGNVGFMSIPCTGYCIVTEQPSDSTYYNGGLATPKPLHPSQRNIRRGPRHRNGEPQPGTPFATPLNGIAVGPDNNIYIAETGANQIDQLSPSVWSSCSSTSCTYNVITLPNANAQPQNLTVGPDGNIWFTDTTGYVGFISLSSCATSCKAYEYKVGSGTGAPWGIVRGTDGNIWFTESATNKIGEVVLQ